MWLCVQREFLQNLDLSSVESKKGSQKSKNGKSKETKAKVTRTFASVQEDKVERYRLQVQRCKYELH